MRFRTRILTAKLRQLHTAIKTILKDFRPIWTEQIPIVKQEISDAFSRANHLPISAATKRWRRRHGYQVGAAPLRASRRLEKAAQGGPGSFDKNQKDSLVVGILLPEAAPNQFGASVTIRHKSDAQKKSGRGRPSKKILGKIRIPARPFIPDGSNENFQTKLSTQLTNFLTRLFIQRLSEAPIKPKD